MDWRELIGDMEIERTNRTEITKRGGREETWKYDTINQLFAEIITQGTIETKTPRVDKFKINLDKFIQLTAIDPKKVKADSLNALRKAYNKYQAKSKTAYRVKDVQEILDKNEKFEIKIHDMRIYISTLNKKLTLEVKYTKTPKKTEQKQTPQQKSQPQNKT